MALTRGRSLAVALLVTALSHAAANAQTDAELEQARAQFAEGVDLMSQGRWGAAASRFRAVMRVRATAQVKYNLGISLVRAGQTAEGLRLLRQVVDDPGLDEASRRQARVEIERLDREAGDGGGGTRREPSGGDGAEGGGGRANGTGDGGGRVDGAGDGSARATGDTSVPAEEEGEGEGEPGENAPPSAPRPFQIDVHAGFSLWGYGFMSGARFGIPLVHEGFLEAVEDALYLTVGADFYFVQRARTLDGWEYGPGIGVPVTLQWQVYFDASWSGFLEIGGQFFVHPQVFQLERFRVYEAGYWVVAAIGISYRIADVLQLTARVGTPSISFGLTFEI